MRAALAALLLLAGIAAVGPARAVEPNEILADPALEARARALSEGLRCLVCQNQSIESSNADLARDLRVLVRERLVAGDSDDQVRAFLVARYGDFVLFEPPMKPATYGLWFGPGLILLLGAGGVILYFRRRRRAVAGAAPLSEAERQRLDRLLAAADSSESGRP